MISLLVVNFRASHLAAQAIATARASSSSPLHVVAVDNSCDPDEAAALRPHADDVIVSQTNSGYAGGINLGRRVCRGEAIVVTNPDVIFAPRAIDELVDALDGAAAAGPALFWDDALRWHLPPGHVHSGWQKLDDVLAGRSRDWRQSQDRRRFLQRVRFWSLSSSTEVETLSGAVLALRTRDLDEAGGFDERFALYFEETDFLRRLRALRRRVTYVPAARCRHLYDQSAAQVAEHSATRYAESERRYLEKWNGPFAARMLKRLERPLPPLPTEHLDAAELAAAVSSLVARAEGDTVVEASPLPSFATAAGLFPEGRVSLPEEVLASVRGPLHVRVVLRRTGRVMGAYTLRA